MKTKNKTEIKKVKIDEHIRASKGTNKPASQSAAPRKRGRPRKTGAEFNAADSITGGSGQSSKVIDQPVDDSVSFTQHSNEVEIEPVYDTTAESRAFLEAPFSVAAGLTGIPKLALYPTQLDAMAPSFKLVYDKRIAPYMGDNADLIAFTMCAMGVVFEKVQVFREESEKRAPVQKPQPSDSAGMPYIPTEHHV